MKSLEDVYKALQEIQARSPTPDRQSMASEPIAASVAVLWRTAPELQVYLVQRALTLRFLPGFWTFPGGKQEADDAGPKATACRELAEETGVLASPDHLQEAGIYVTPSIAPLRFTTRFYLAELPVGQTADFTRSDGELMAGAWVAPLRALQQFESGELLMNAPIVGLVRALVDGIAGAQTRAVRAAQMHSHRLWVVTGGVALSPLLTPTLPPATRTNCVVIGTGALVVIDPASPHPAEREALCQALDARIAEGQSVEEIWLTHHHGDHVGAAEYMSERYGVPICAHALTAERLVGICRIDRILTDGESKILPGPQERELRCIFTPGHAPGHLCFLETRTQTLIAGDMVAQVGSILIDPYEGDMMEYLASLRRIDALNTRLLIPAHGSVVTSPHTILTQYYQHRLQREAQILGALSSTGQSIPELVAQVYRETPKFLHELAGRSLLAHLIKLQREGRAVERDSAWSML